MAVRLFAFCSLLCVTVAPAEPAAACNFADADAACYDIMHVEGQEQGENQALTVELLQLQVHKQSPTYATVDGQSRLKKCVKDYSEGLNALRPGLGDDVANHPLHVEKHSLRELIIGAGFGTTGTSSLYEAMEALGLNSYHCCNAANVTTIMAQPSQEQCKEQLRTLDLIGIPEKHDVLLDTPVPEVFLSLFVTFPEAKYILTTRNASEWVASRKAKHPYTFAPIEEPCGLLMTGNFDILELERMFDLHNELVRCSVPQERLLEINIFESSSQRLYGMMDELADFIGLPRMPQHMDFPYSSESGQV